MRTRLPTTLTVTYINEMRSCDYRVESVCEVLASQGLKIAPKSFRSAKVRPLSKRNLSDVKILARLRQPGELGARGLPRPEVFYGRRKMTA